MVNKGETWKRRIFTLAEAIVIFIVLVHISGFNILTGLQDALNPIDKIHINESIDKINDSLEFRGDTIGIYIWGHNLTIDDESLPDRIVLVVTSDKVMIGADEGGKFDVLDEVPFDEGTIDIKGQDMVIMHHYYYRVADGWRFEIYNSNLETPSPLEVIARPVVATNSSQHLLLIGGSEPVGYYRYAISVKTT